MPIISVSNFT